jgi:hypothetical protein
MKKISEKLISINKEESNKRNKKNNIKDKSNKQISENINNNNKEEKNKYKSGK